jgi:hypothetical protein
MLRRLNTVVVSDEEKARTTGQAGTGKASASEPLMKCRDQLNGIETGAPPVAPGKSLADIRLLARRCPA